MKYNKVSLLVFTVFFLLCSGVCALDIRSGDNIVIDQPVDDDIFATGDTMVVNAPVKSVTWAGNLLTINAPVSTNLIAAGNIVEVNSPVRADLIMAGSKLVAAGDVKGKIIAAGDRITVTGKVGNIVASGNSVALESGAEILGDAIISSTSFSNDGTVKGTLEINKEGFRLPVSDIFDFGDQASEFVSDLLYFLSLLVLLGWFLAGLLIIFLFPEWWKKTQDYIFSSSLQSFLIGVVVLIFSAVGMLILAVSVVGLPFLLICMFSISIALLLSVPVVSSAFGKWIIGFAGRGAGKYAEFTIGFLVLHILFMLPFIGFLIKFIVIMAGFGAFCQILYEVNK